MIELLNQYPWLVPLLVFPACVGGCVLVIKGVVEFLTWLDCQ